ncbi:uncharacterized protein LOC120454616 [Drosophila santomea]|uniref:uncharacterized protein LOC120454616 n=1 Tax=Drosophila santomea TaxID=129105 RepID=UPI001953AD48|nr:uncharacterized protein LOC120454616 [Drosophila santomea]
MRSTGGWVVLVAAMWVRGTVRMQRCGDKSCLKDTALQEELPTRWLATKGTSCQDADADADADGCLCSRNIVANCTETTTMHSSTLSPRAPLQVMGVMPDA